MPTAGRSNWLCRCGARLAVVRGSHPRRRLQVCLGVPQAQHREDGTVVVHCPQCGRDNRFEWRVPVKGK